MRALYPGLLLTLFVCLMPTTTRADEKAQREFVHEANILAKLGNHPNVITFIGASSIQVGFESGPIENNPIYDGQVLTADNPLYSASGEPGTPEVVQSIRFELDNTRLAHLHKDNVVHRDIATRNFLVTTDQGDYVSDVDAFLLFGNDGPPDLRTHVGPVRWMAPETLKLHRIGSTDPNDVIEIQSFSFFHANYVPAPTVFVLALPAMALISRRRRG